jgi:hypothetical protein
MAETTFGGREAVVMIRSGPTIAGMHSRGNRWVASAGSSVHCPSVLQKGGQAKGFDAVSGGVATLAGYAQYPSEEARSTSGFGGSGAMAGRLKVEVNGRAVSRDIEGPCDLFPPDGV